MTDFSTSADKIEELPWYAKYDGEKAKNLGKAVLGVDYETMNPTARAFWEKYSTPYTISMVRRVDI